jgi:hypothetical protein
MRRSRSFHRFMNQVKKQHKIRIISHWKNWAENLESPIFVGKLVKGKVHCSCFMCNGYRKRAVSGPKHNEILILSDELIEEYGEAYKKLGEKPKLNR